MDTPWLDIPLADYEGHMSLSTIGQAQMLATLFAELLAEFSPPSVAVVGCAGGNGFDQICMEATRRVAAVDINPHYLEALSNRYADRIPGLELYAGDIQSPALTFAPVDLIYAALLFEYVAPAPVLANLKAACRPQGVLASVLQLPSGTAAAVSPSPFTSLQALAPVMHLVTPADLLAHAKEAGFVPLSAKKIALPSGKKFAVQVFQLPAGENVPIRPP
ncbi:MAG: class I SAM-dependent methyltransferase [Desulfuromonadaceae bacterium]|nr:class I SAM-dependent methyltransferase [Desulfuromonadaceae bacterium]